MTAARSSLLALAAAAVLAPVPAAHAEYRGKLEIRHSDDFARERTHTSYKLITRGGRKLPLTLARAPRTPSGSSVIVRGKRHGSRIRGTVLARGFVRAAGVTAGPRKTAVILINFATDTRQPWTPDAVRQRVFTNSTSTSAFYSEESYGDVSLTGKLRSDGDVFGWYTIAAPTAGCDVDTWADQAQAAAAADGFSLNGYQHVIYAFPTQSSCGGWAGLGELPGVQSWMNGDISTRVVAHELGHNMGLHHASSLTCTSGGTVVAYTPSSTCTPDEYGDPFDVMGSSARHNNAWHLRQIGFLSRTNTATVSTSGTYTITSAIARGTGSQTQLLRVPVPNSSPQNSYDLEVRSTGGVFDNYLSTSPAVNGVTIHKDPDPSVITQSKLIDATPGSSSGFADAPLPPGATFSDGTVSITVSAVTGGSATVDVVTAPAPDTTPPSTPALSAAAGSDRVTLSWPASTDDVGVSGYRVYRDGVLKATVSSPGWVDTAVSPGTSYSYKVAAFDAAGNVATSAAAVATVPAPPAPPAPAPAPSGSTDTSSTPPPSSSTTPTPEPPPVTVDPPTTTTQPPRDTIRPVVLIRYPAQRARVRRSRARVYATAADAVGVVRTEVWVDGVRRKTVAGRLVNWRMGRAAHRGRHVITVRAYDAAGNHGKATVRVQIVR